MLRDLEPSCCGVRGFGVCVASVQKERKKKKKKSIAKNRITHLTLLYFMWLILVMIVERCLELLVGFF